ncbi:MAG: methyltransferase domain-containing protein [Candidatus Thorarchaeota archaeon]|nr:methyltransferase domain-containing protein [Candidatus Thorarchaeota archaeon]
MGPKRTHGKSPDEHSRIVRDGYDKIAHQYMQEREQYCNDKEIQEFINRLHEKARVLDIGCGGGVPVLKMMLENGFIATGIDFSKTMLEIAKKNVPDAHLIHGDVTKADFESNFFDGIISTYAIIHIHKSLHPVIYAQIYKWLKPGGVMLMGTSWSDWEEIAEYMGVDMAWSHPAPDTSLQMVKNAGFEVIFDRLVPTGNNETVYWILARKN